MNLIWVEIKVMWIWYIYIYIYTSCIRKEKYLIGSTEKKWILIASLQVLVRFLCGLAIIDNKLHCSIFYAGASYQMVRISPYVESAQLCDLSKHKILDYASLIIKFDFCISNFYYIYKLICSPPLKRKHTTVQLWSRHSYPRMDCHPLCILLGLLSAKYFPSFLINDICGLNKIVNNIRVL